MTKFTGVLGGGFPVCPDRAAVLAEGTATAPKPPRRRSHTPATKDTVLATVNGTNITMGDVIVTYASIADQYKQMPDDQLFKGILDQLVQQVALEQELGDKLSAKDLLVLQATKRNYLANVALDPIAKAAVTDEALKAAYDAAVAAMPPVTEYHASHILVDSEDSAKKLLADIQGGKPFADVAMENSTDGSAKAGGDLGWFSLGTMVQPFEDAVVAATVGTVAGPVQTDFGWHLILVTETRVKAPPTLDEMRDQLSGQIQADAIKAYLKVADRQIHRHPHRGRDRPGRDERRRASGSVIARTGTRGQDGQDRLESRSQGTEEADQDPARRGGQGRRQGRSPARPRSRPPRRPSRSRRLPPPASPRCR